MADPVITVTPTVMDGQVVRWHRNLTAAEYNTPVLSASRYGVQVHNDAYLHSIPWLADADAAYRALKADRHADLSNLATHRRSGLFGPLQPVTKESTDA